MMSNNLFLDSLVHTQRVFDYTFEQPIEQEILLADYDEAVFKIVKTNLEHNLTQKYITNSKLILEGYFKLNVYYQPPDSEQLALSSHKIPFQKQIDINCNVETPYFVWTTGESQFINTRAVNPTRIDIRGAYKFSVKVYSKQEIPIVTAINSKTICSEDISLEHFSLIGQGIRQFSIEEDMPLAEDTKQILNVNISSANNSSISYQDKVNVKGEIIADIWYTTTQNDSISKITQNFKYNQIVDIPKADESNISYTQFIPVGFTITQNSESKNIVGSLTIQLDAKVFKQQQVYAIRDVFSKKYEYQTKIKNIVYDQNLKAINKNIAINLEDTVENGYKVIHTFAQFGEIRSYFEVDKTIVKAKVNVGIILQNLQNEYECITKTEDCIIETINNSNQHDEYLADIKVLNISSSITEDKLKIKINAVVDGFTILRKEVLVLEDFLEDTEKELENTKQALILYYSEKGESVFEIARRYRVSTSCILKENEMEGKVVAEDKMLFIPAFDN